jgi:hypothetical protein
MATISHARTLVGSPLFWIGTLFASVGMLFLAIGVKAMRDEATFQHSAAVAEGKIVGRDIRRASAWNQQSTRYLLTYMFTTENRVLVTGQGEVSVEEWEAAREGGPLTVRYLPKRPSENRLTLGGDWSTAIACTSLGAILGGVGGVVAGIRVRRWRLVTRLERDGASTPGTLARVASGSYRINRVPQWQLFYTFTDQSGKRRDGVSDWLSPQAAKRWKTGAAGTVRYDPRDPTRSIWVDAEAPESDR